MKVLKQMLAIALVAILPALVSARWHPRRPAPPGEGEIEISVVRAWKKPVLWIDARPAPDYAREHVPGALSLNEDAWDAGISEVVLRANGSVPLIVYCGADCNASAQVAHRLRQMGLQPVYVLKGGWETWKRDHP